MQPTITIANEGARGGVTKLLVKTLFVKTYVLTYGHGELTTFQWLTGLPTS